MNLLFKAQGALLDDEDLIGNITDAKASVVQATNAQKNADEASESLESKREEYLPLIKCFTNVYITTESFKKIDPIYYFDTDSDYFDILSQCWSDSKAKNASLSVPERVVEVIPIALKVICEFIVNGLHSTHKIPFLLLFIIRGVYANEDEDELGEVMYTLSGKKIQNIWKISYYFLQNLFITLMKWTLLPQMTEAFSLEGLLHFLLH